MKIFLKNIPTPDIDEIFFAYSCYYEPDYILEITTDEYKILISTHYINIPDININIHQATFESYYHDTNDFSDENYGYLFKDSINNTILYDEIGSGVVIALKNVLNLDIENLLCNLVLL